MIAQQLAFEFPDMARRIILLGAGPRGGEGMTFTELSVDELGDPVSLLMYAFFTPSDASQAAGHAYLERLKLRATDRDEPVSRQAAIAQLESIREWGAIPSENRFAITEVFRQAAQSRIITSAHRINQDSIPDLNPPEAESDFFFVQVEDPETAVARIIELVKTRIPKRFGLDPIRDIHVLCPMNRGGAGARSLNIELQAALNPAGDRKVERFGWTFAPGDKVMQIENDYEKEVYNGDIGTIDDVDSNSGELIASFDGRSVTYGFGELDMLVPAYAATIHKSQGSEFPP